MESTVQKVITFSRSFPGFITMLKSYDVVDYCVLDGSEVFLFIDDTGQRSCVKRITGHEEEYFTVSDTVITIVEDDTNA